MNELNKKERFICLEEVINRTSLKKTAIYSQIQKGRFPRPINLGINRTAWLESEEETTIIESLLNWLLTYESKFIEYPENPHRTKPNEIAGIRVLANTSSNEQEYFFIYPKTFREITKDYPRTMVFNVLSSAGILIEPRRHEKGYEYQVKIPKSIDGRSARAYKIIPVLENESLDS